MHLTHFDRFLTYLFPRNTTDTPVCAISGFTRTVYVVTVRDSAFSLLFNGRKLLLEGRWLSFSDVGTYCSSTV